MKGFFTNMIPTARFRIIQTGSLSELAWKKFKKNHLAFGALIFILFTAFVAILGYQITPDSTPYANDQMLQIATLKPLSKVNLLYVRKNAKIPEKGFFEKMIFGERSRYDKVPFSSYELNDEYLILKEYSKNESSDERILRYHLGNIYYTIDPDREIVKLQNNILQIPLLKNGSVRIPVDELQKKILDQNIKSRIYWLGTDRFGRDLLSRLLIGTRVSLSVGFISVLISLLIGISLGAIAGFFRGRTDDLIIWLINVVWSIPTLLLVIAITFALGKGFWQVFIAVGLTMWVEVARVVRGQIISIREKEFIEAGRALGYTNFRIIYRHILPNVMSPVIVISAANFASAILIEAGLSFLGIGVQPPMPSWGSMIKEHYGYLILDSAYLAILPGLAIVLMVLAFMLIGNALRDAMDVKAA